MSQYMALAAAPMTEIIRNIQEDHLGAPTPCAEYDVRRLVNHLLFWGPSLEGAARKELVPPPAAAESDLDLTGGDWAAAVNAHIDRTVNAWNDPGAWEGTTHMGGPTELPASMVGNMVLCEVVVHGWDLARATGQRPTWDDDLLGYLHGKIAEFAEQGRQMGVFGSEVVPPTSSALDRTLALTGRDPAWTP
jgi:uncharacterized protein (TIGR03086 family)